MTRVRNFKSRHCFVAGDSGLKHFSSGRVDIIAGIFLDFNDVFYSTWLSSLHIEAALLGGRTIGDCGLSHLWGFFLSVLNLSRGGVFFVDRLARIGSLCDWIFSLQVTLSSEHLEEGEIKYRILFWLNLYSILPHRNFVVHELLGKFDTLHLPL